MTLPEKYMKGLTEEVDTLRIFEIGSRGGPVDRGLSARRARNVTYREIHYSIPFFGDNPKIGETYQNLTANTDRSYLVWDARKIPYPFETGYFDEMHCHMIDENVADRTGIPQFAREIGRIGAPMSTFFFTAQCGMFFGDTRINCLTDFVDSMKLLASALETDGFRTEVLQHRPQALYDVDSLTDYERHVNGFLIAKRG